jgi:hypothetical protein
MAAANGGIKEPSRGPASWCKSAKPRIFVKGLNSLFWTNTPTFPISRDAATAPKRMGPVSQATMTLSDDEIAAIDKPDMEPGRNHFNVGLLSSASCDRAYRQRAPFEQHLENTRADSPKD